MAVLVILLSSMGLNALASIVDIEVKKVVTDTTDGSGGGNGSSNGGGGRNQVTREK